MHLSSDRPLRRTLIVVVVVVVSGVEVGTPSWPKSLPLPPRPLYLRHAGGWLDLSRGRIMHVLEVNRRGWPACKTWAWTGPRSAQ